MPPLFPETEAQVDVHLGFPIKFVGKLRQLFQRLLNRLSASKTHFSIHSEEQKKKRSVEASSSERSCYQAAQWLWLSILISVWGVFSQQASLHVYISTECVCDVCLSQRKYEIQ